MNSLSKNLKIRASRIQCQQSFPRILIRNSNRRPEPTWGTTKDPGLVSYERGYQNRRGGEVLIHLLYFCLKSKLCLDLKILQVFFKNRGEILVFFKKNVEFLEFFGFTLCFRRFQAKKNFKIFQTDF